MDLETNLSLYLLTDWFDNLVLESLVDFSLIVVNRNVWLLQMLNVPKHVERITKSHEEIVQLVWSLRVAHDHVKDKWEQRSDPVDESTPCRLLDDLLPVCHNLKPLAEISDLT